MKRPFFSTPLILIANLIVGPALITRSEVLILPSETTNKFGDFWYNGSGEQVYASSEFRPLKADVVVLTGIEFRTDESHTNMFAGKSNYVGIYLYVFPGTMDEIIQRKSGIPDDPNLGDRVFSGTIQLPTNKPDPEVFDLKFPFIFPFIYHPDAGQLVLEFRSGIAATLDAQGVVYDRGVHITTEFLGEREVHSGMFVTRFTYQTVFVQINSIHQLESSFEIEFTQYGAKEIELVGTRDPAGPYALDAEAKIEEIQPAGGGRFKAVVPNSRDLRFFRIRAS